MSEDERDAVRAYAGGEITARRGIVNPWLAVVYVSLTLWAIDYLGRYWGGLGPGLAR